jgi:hypothetical protein
MAEYVKQEAEAEQAEKAMKERVIKRRRELENAKREEEQVRDSQTVYNFFCLLFSFLLFVILRSGSHMVALSC